MKLNDDLNNNFISNGGEDQICFVFVTGVYFAAALVNTVAVTINGVLSVNFAAAYAVAVYAYAYAWNTQQVYNDTNQFNGNGDSDFKLIKELYINDIITSK